MAADVQNAYLQDPSSEKNYIICGPEFGLENVGKIARIKRALYGGKYLEGIYDITCEVAWISWDLSHVEATLMFGGELLPRKMGRNTMNMFFFMWMTALWFCINQRPF